MIESKEAGVELTVITTEESQYPVANDLETEQSQPASIEPVKSLPPPPDGGYGWVVVAASFFIHVFILGNMYSFGVYYPAYVEEFNVNPASIAWVGSIGSALMTGIGTWTGKYADQYGNSRIVFLGAILTALGYLIASFSTEIWHLYVTQGLICGCGYSCAFIAGVSVVGQWFSKNRGIAVGIAVAGSGLGQFAITLITGMFLESYGWRTTLRLMALITFIGLTLCSLVIRRYLPLIHAKHMESSMSMFQDRNFTIIFVAALFNSLGMNMPYNYIPVYGLRYGMSTSAVVLILSLMGISSAIGRIGLGFGGDRMGKIAMLRLCMFGSSVSTFCWMACRTFPSLLTYGLIYGFFAGGTISLIPAVAAELFGLKKLSSIIGVLYTSTALGNLLSAPIGGFLFEATGNFFTSQAVAATFLMIGFILSMFVVHKLHHEHHEHHHHHHYHHQGNHPLPMDEEEESGKMRIDDVDSRKVMLEMLEEENQRDFDDAGSDVAELG